MKVWQCKIVVPDDTELPSDADSILRRAGIDAATESHVCFSGWGGELTEDEAIIARQVFDSESWKSAQDVKDIRP